MMWEQEMMVRELRAKENERNRLLDELVSDGTITPEKADEKRKVKSETVNA